MPRLRSPRGAPLVRVAPYRIRKVGIVSTLLPGLASKVIEKTLQVTEERLAPAGATIVAERRVPHEQRALAEAHGGGARRRRRARHRVRRFRHRRPARCDSRRGRGDRRARSSISACRSIPAICCWWPPRAAVRCSARRAARARRRRTVSTGCSCGCSAGFEVPREAITGMGVGGLLMEIVTRPQPRAEPPAAARAPHRRDRARGRPLDPHGRTEQAPRRDRAAGRSCVSPSRKRWRHAPSRSSW